MKRPIQGAQGKLKVHLNQRTMKLSKLRSSGNQVDNAPLCRHTSERALKGKQILSFERCRRLKRTPDLKNKWYEKDIPEKRTKLQANYADHPERQGFFMKDF